jgi:hypothetical protein
VYDTRTRHQTGKPTEKARNLCHEGLNGFETVHGIGEWVFGRRESSLRVCELCGSLQGKCMYRYPSADDESKGVISLLSGRRRSHGCGLSEAESVVLRKNATIVAGHSLKICLYSGKQWLRLVSL